MYEIARKHCGKQAEWKISLELLQRKCGSQSSLREFRRLVMSIVEEDREHHHMPDYSVEIDEDDMVTFRNRGSMVAKIPTPPAPFAGHISGDGYEDAKAVAPGWDVYFLEREWREWISEPPKHVDAAFVSFCRKWYEKRGKPQ